MSVPDKLKDMVEELRQDLREVKDHVKGLLSQRSEGDSIPVRHSPAEHPIAALQRQTNRLFDDFLHSWWSPFEGQLAPFGDVLAHGWPRIDVDESDAEIRIRADLAGMEQDDVDVSLADGVLTIRGEKRREEEDSGRHHYRRECFYGAFSRSVPVSADVDVDQVEASMKNGVLKVSLPKLPDSKRRGRRIRIRRD